MYIWDSTDKVPRAISKVGVPEQVVRGTYLPLVVVQYLSVLYCVGYDRALYAVQYGTLLYGTQLYGTLLYGTAYKTTTYVCTRALCGTWYTVKACGYRGAV